MIGSIGHLENIIYSDLYLSAVYSVDRFFYAIFDKNHNLLQSDLDPIDKSELADLVSRGFHKKILAIDGTSVHLPEQIEVGDLLDSFVHTAPGGSSHSDRILGAKANTHYVIDRKSEEIITAFFQPDEIFNLSTVVASYMYPATKDKVMVLITEGSLYISAMGPDGPKLLNRYAATEKEDILYYLLLVFDKLKLDPLGTRIDVAGKIKNDAGVLNHLKSYFSNIQFVEPVILNLPENSDHPKHLFLDQYMTYLCAL